MKRNITLLLAISLLTAPSLSARSILTAADRIAIHNQVNKHSAENIKFRSPANTRIEMLVRYSDASTLENLRRQGAEIVDIFGSEIAVVALPANKAEEVAAAKGVRSARVSRQLHLVNNQGHTMSMAHNVWSGVNLPRGYDGSNVVVGIYDTGIDANHPHFTDNNGTSRVMAIYEYPDSESTPKEYTTPDQIKRFTTDDRTQCHGSHVLGSMTGAFHIDGRPDYRGTAPGAQIVIATGQGYEAQILDAVKRTGEYARSKGLPAVMNLSWGDNIGPHDGSDEFTKALNDLAVEYDMVIACAAGNERDQDIAIVKDLTENDTVCQTLLMPGSSTSNPNQGYGAFQVWTADSLPFTLHLDVMRNTTPDVPYYTLTYSPGEEKYLASGNKIYDYVNPADSLEIISSDTAFQKYFSRSFIGGYTGISSLNGRYCADMYAYLNSSNRNSFYMRIRVEGHPGQRIFMYTEDSRCQQFGKAGMTNADAPDGYGTNSNMASGPNTMSVGAYVSNNISSSGYPSGKISDISYFSSYGPTLDGREIPDLCAPGQVIVSSRNSYLTSTYPYGQYEVQKDPVTGKNVEFTTMSGTSQATPNAAGCAALIRQIAPEFTYRQVIDMLKATCAEPKYESDGWGNGMIDVHSAALATIINSGIAGNKADGRETIIIRRNNGEYEIAVPSADTFSVIIYDIVGHLIKRMDIKGNRCTISTDEFFKGTYIATVKSAANTRTIKFMR